MKFLSAASAPPAFDCGPWICEAQRELVTADAAAGLATNILMRCDLSLSGNRTHRCAHAHVFISRCPKSPVISEFIAANLHAPRNNRLAQRLRAIADESRRFSGNAPRRLHRMQSSLKPNLPIRRVHIRHQPEAGGLHGRQIHSAVFDNLGTLAPTTPATVSPSTLIDPARQRKWMSVSSMSLRPVNIAGGTTHNAGFSLLRLITKKLTSYATAVHRDRHRELPMSQASFITIWRHAAHHQFSGGIDKYHSLRNRLGNYRCDCNGAGMTVGIRPEYLRKTEKSHCSLAGKPDRIAGNGMTR